MQYLTRSEVTNLPNDKSLKQCVLHKNLLIYYQVPTKMCPLKLVLSKPKLHFCSGTSINTVSKDTLPFLWQYSYECCHNNYCQLAASLSLSVFKALYLRWSLDLLFALNISPHQQNPQPYRHVKWADCDSAVASSVCEILPVDQVSSGCDARQLSVSYDTRIAGALGNSLQLSLLCVKFM